MITQIWGDPGVGKSALMVNFALDFMTGAQARQDVRNCAAMTAQLNAGGFDFTAPTDHLVYADMSIFARHGTVRNHDCDGFDLGLYDPNHVTKLFPPYTRFFLDESQRYFNSRVKSGVSDSVSRFFELHRHNFFEFWLVSQRPILIDKNIRGLSERVIEVVCLEHKYDHGRIFSSTWHCHVYENSECAISAADGGSASFVEEDFHFVGNIFQHYNSHYHQPAFYNAAYGRDFERGYSVDYGFTVDDIRDYNNAHSYSVRPGFFKRSY